MHDHLLMTKQAARLLGCTEATLALWRRQQSGPAYVRVGRRLIRYRSQDLASWVERNTNLDMKRPRKANIATTAKAGEAAFR